MSTAEQIALVVHTLGFGKRQLAEIFGVSRQALSDWRKRTKEAECCFSYCLVESPRRFAGLFRRRIAWDDEAIREAVGAGAVAVLMNRCCCKR